MCRCAYEHTAFLHVRFPTIPDARNESDERHVLSLWRHLRLKANVASAGNMKAHAFALRNDRADGLIRRLSMWLLAVPARDVAHMPACYIGERSPTAAGKIPPWSAESESGRFLREHPAVADRWKAIDMACMLTCMHMASGVECEESSHADDEGSLREDQPWTFDEWAQAWADRQTAASLG
jgi:hypothetical protein